MDRAYDDNLVSIVMPAYNAGNYIRETVESVLRQSYTNWELIIVDDCSSDGTKDIIKEYCFLCNKIVSIHLMKNKGVANARNIALDNAKGRYIAFLDSDDIWTEDKLSKQIKFMKENNYYFTYHDYIMFDTSMKKEYGKRIKVPNRVDYKELLKGNSTGSCLTTILDRKVIKEIYMPQQRHEDFICWLDILKKYDISAYGLNCVLGYYRVGKVSVSSNKIKSAYWTWKVYRDSQNIGLLRSVYYFINYALKGLIKYKV